MKNRKISILTKEDILNAKDEFDVARNSFKQANLTEQELDVMMEKYKQHKKKIETMSDKEKTIYREEVKKMTDSYLAPYEEEKRRVRIKDRKQRAKQRAKSFLISAIFIAYYVVACYVFKYFYDWYQKIDIIFSLVCIFLLFGIPFFVDFLIRKYKIKIIKK